MFFKEKYMLSKSKEEKISKFLSYVLRHKPDSIGLSLDKSGWANVDDLIAKSKDFELSKEIIEQVVKSCAKQRYKLSDDGTMIRANQGHSVEVELGLKNEVPPVVLYHGTATRFLNQIQKKGLVPMSRHAVHLSQDVEVAKTVGKRHGELIVLEIDSKRMYADGFKFQKSENGVWLVDSVPPKYFKTMDLEYKKNKPV